MSNLNKKYFIFIFFSEIYFFVNFKKDLKDQFYILEKMKKKGKFKNFNFNKYNYFLTVYSSFLFYL